MYILLLVLCHLVCSGLANSPASTHVSINIVDQATIGIGFTLDRVISSISLPYSSSEGLVERQCGPKYRSLMRSYLDLSEAAHSKQTSPIDPYAVEWGRPDRRRNWKSKIPRRDDSWTGWISSWVWDTAEASLDGILQFDNFPGDEMVEILAEEIIALKKSSESVLKARYNHTLPAWPHVTLAAPSFLWTTIAPEPEVDNMANWDWLTGDSAWVLTILSRFSGAAHRPGFRQSAKDDPLSIMENHALIGVIPAGFYAVRYEHLNRTTLGEWLPMTWTSINVDLNEEALSLWADGPRCEWTPRNTFTSLGAQARHGVERASYWDQVVGKVMALLHSIETADSPLRIVLTGTGWSPDDTACLENAMQAEAKLNHTTLHRLDRFAVSRAAAETGRVTWATDGICTVGMGAMPENVEEFAAADQTREL